MHCIAEKPRKHRACRREAFTIVELVVALAIIALLVVAVYGAITSGIGTVRMARENLRATQILLAKTEVIRLYNWDQLKTGFVPAQFVANYDTASASTNSGILYYGSLTIGPADTGTTYADDMREVTVTVNWKTGSINRTRQMKTYVCKSGIQNYVY
jgi:prepilin-type N-terminal cleavage/methylation domain-containing protein